jgi:hypothetical protein
MLRELDVVGGYGTFWCMGPRTVGLKNTFILEMVDDYTRNQSFWIDLRVIGD